MMANNKEGFHLYYNNFHLTNRIQTNIRQNSFKSEQQLNNQNKSKQFFQ